jgi:hypothetical protein
MSKTINQIKRTDITNNTQRAAMKLLTADGQWVSRGQLNRIPSATARVRDLRKPEYGAFKVDCKSSDELGKKLSKRTYYYRIARASSEQLSTLFRI